VTKVGERDQRIVLDWWGKEWGVVLNIAVMVREMFKSMYREE
jgi:hypothetical protein